MWCTYVLAGGDGEGGDGNGDRHGVHGLLGCGSVVGDDGGDLRAPLDCAGGDDGGEGGAGGGEDGSSAVLRVFVGRACHVHVVR